MSPVPDDYVDVAERLREFRGLYPEGTLQSKGDPFLFTVGERTYIAYCAAAYRTPDDIRPGIGWAWEPVPGTNPWTKDSELQNAETSAWGRAIVALGFETKKIASADEVRNRTAAGEVSTRGDTSPSPGVVGASAADSSGGAAAAMGTSSNESEDGQAPPDSFPVSMPETKPRPALPGQKGELRDILEQLYLREKRAPDGNTWTALAEAFWRDQYAGVQRWDQLNEFQFDRVIQYMRPFLKREQVKA